MSEDVLVHSAFFGFVNASKDAGKGVLLSSQASLHRLIMTDRKERI